MQYITFPNSNQKKRPLMASEHSIQKKTSMSLRKYIPDKKATDWLGRQAKLDSFGQKVWYITAVNSEFAVYGAKAVKFTAVAP